MRRAYRRRDLQQASRNSRGCSRGALHRTLLSSRLCRAALAKLSLPPHQATLQVHSVNGLLHNGRDCPKGSVTQLCNNDELVICERIFKWESASVEAVIVDARSTLLSFFLS